MVSITTVQSIAKSWISTCMERLVPTGYIHSLMGYQKLSLSRISKPSGILSAVFFVKKGAAWMRVSKGSSSINMYREHRTASVRRPQSPSFSTASTVSSSVFFLSSYFCFFSSSFCKFFAPLKTPPVFTSHAAQAWSLRYLLSAQDSQK